MLIAHWIQIYFLFFSLWILMFLKGRNNTALSSFFIAGCFDYQSSAGLLLFYALIFIAQKLKIKFLF